MKSQTCALALALLLSQAPWHGDLGRETIAYIAQNFGVNAGLNVQVRKVTKWAVTSATATFFQTILGDTSTSYLANIATYLRFQNILCRSGRV
jgi:hypothetical protein